MGKLASLSWHCWVPGCAQGYVSCEPVCWCASGLTGTAEGSKSKWTKGCGPALGKWNIINFIGTFPAEILEEAARLWITGYKLGNYRIVPNTEVPVEFQETSRTSTPPTTHFTFVPTNEVAQFSTYMSVSATFRSVFWFPPSLLFQFRLLCDHLYPNFISSLLSVP